MRSENLKKLSLSSFSLLSFFTVGVSESISEQVTQVETPKCKHGKCRKRAKVRCSGMDTARGDGACA
jgi:hypothetical protein